MESEILIMWKKLQVENKTTQMGNYVHTKWFQNKLLRLKLHQVQYMETSLTLYIISSQWLKYMLTQIIHVAPFFWLTV